MGRAAALRRGWSVLAWHGHQCADDARVASRHRPVALARREEQVAGRQASRVVDQTQHGVLHVEFAQRRRFQGTLAVIASWGERRSCCFSSYDLQRTGDVSRHTENQLHAQDTKRLHHRRGNRVEAQFAARIPKTLVPDKH